MQNRLERLTYDTGNLGSDLKVAPTADSPPNVGRASRVRPALFNGTRPGIRRRPNWPPTTPAHHPLIPADARAAPVPPHGGAVGLAACKNAQQALLKAFPTSVTPPEGRDRGREQQQSAHRQPGQQQDQDQDQRQGQGQGQDRPGGRSDATAQDSHPAQAETTAQAGTQPARNKTASTDRNHGEPARVLCTLGYLCVV